VVRRAFALRPFFSERRAAADGEIAAENGGILLAILLTFA
jgi:hypothetical protein